MHETVEDMSRATRGFLVTKIRAIFGKGKEHVGGPYLDHVDDPLVLTGLPSTR